MTKIGLVIVISLVLSVINAVGRTFCELSESNTVGADEGTATDFVKDGHDVIFHEKFTV